MTEIVQLKQIGVRKEIYEELNEIKGQRIQYLHQNQSLSDVLEWILTVWKRTNNDGTFDQ